MFRKKGSLFRRIFFPLLIITLIGLSLMGSALILSYTEERIEARVEELEVITMNTEWIIKSLSHSNIQPKAGLQLLTRTMSQDVDVLYVEQGKIICDCHEAIKCRHQRPEYLFWISENIIKNSDKINEKKGYNALMYNLPETEGGMVGLYRVKVVDDGIIVATRTINLRENTYLKRALWTLFLAILVAFVVVYIFTYIWAYRVSKPVSQMTKATKKYAQGDFSERIYVDRDDEIGELTKSFNKMATELSITENSRRAFVANVSHELKTPMTTIGGFIDGINDGTIPPEKRGYYLNIVSSEIKRLSRLVNQMLNLSRIEEGKAKLNPTEFNVSKQLVDTILTFEKGIEDKGIGITGLDTLDSIYLYADEDMINQVIYNLVENAIKFTPQNGRIDFRVDETDNAVAITIGNTGDGIPSELLPRIFERFYKVDASRSNDKKGAGLGLYLVKTLVELHGGHVEVSSIEGEYTQFSFTLPKKNNK